MTRLQLRRFGAVVLGATALTLIAPAHALFGEKAVPPAVVPKNVDEATKSNLAKEFLLLNFAKAGQRLVVVGEYGHILLSDDDGKTWRQAQSVPTKSTLTSVVFPDEKTGFAVGHDTIVIKTKDGGETWTRQHGGGDNDDALLTVVFTDAQHGLAMGAFNFTLETQDGGVTWKRRALVADAAKAGAAPAAAAPAAPAPGGATDADALQAQADAEAEAKAKASGVDDAYKVAEGDDAHINHAFSDGKGVVIVAAEAGKIYRSTDQGKTFEKVQSEYPGSFWGGTFLADGSILVVGMRGNIWRSVDQGKTWTKSDTSGADQSIASVVQSPDGTILAAGLSGALLVSKDGGKTFAIKYRDDRKGLNAITLTAAGRILVAGEVGLSDVTDEIATMPAPTPTAKAPAATGAVATPVSAPAAGGATAKPAKN